MIVIAPYILYLAFLVIMSWVYLKPSRDERRRLIDKLKGMQKQNRRCLYDSGKSKKRVG